MPWRMFLESPPMPSRPAASAALRELQLSLFDDAAASPAAPADPLAFLHPRTQRQVMLGGHPVGYALRRARRRSIGFVVGVEGLAVSAPRWVTLADIDAALREKAAWILRKLHEQRERGRRLEAARVVWRSGETLPFLGAPVRLVLDASISGVGLRAASAGSAALHVGLPPTADAAQVRDAVQAWLQRQARRIFDERCAHFAGVLGVRVKRVALSSAATRWGSASADGSIRLNWRLVHFAPAVIDYVVTHELAHLREMNHGPAFWDVVRSALPGFEASRDVLRHEVLPVFD